MGHSVVPYCTLCTISQDVSCSANSQDAVVRPGIILCLGLALNVLTGSTCGGKPLEH
jgi:hypothetical protein